MVMPFCFEALGCAYLSLRWRTAANKPAFATQDVDGQDDVDGSRHRWLRIAFQVDSRNGKGRGLCGIHRAGRLLLRTGQPTHAKVTGHRDESISLQELPYSMPRVKTVGFSSEFVAGRELWVVTARRN